MQYRKQIILTGATLVIAVGIGFVMQRSQSAQTLYGEKAAPRGEVLTDADAALLDIEDIVLTSAEFGTQIQKPESEAIVFQASAPMITAPEAGDISQVQGAPQEDVLIDDLQAEADCPITAQARPVAAAMVNLTLKAPCLPNERLTVHHSGLLFNQTTDAQGTLEVTLPALAEQAMFILAFSNGEGTVAQATVEEISDFDRVAVLWKGDTGFELHALEYGAFYGDEGHVWSGAMRDMSFAVTGQGGYISRLGDVTVPDGMMGEIYTFPIDNARRSGNVDLSIEAEVDDENCGLEIEAKTLQMHAGGEIVSKDLTLSVPDCGAAGNFLVLNNLFEDLKVAVN